MALIGGEHRNMRRWEGSGKVTRWAMDLRAGLCWLSRAGGTVAAGRDQRATCSATARELDVGWRERGSQGYLCLVLPIASVEPVKNIDPVRNTCLWVANESALLPLCALAFRLFTLIAGHLGNTLRHNQCPNRRPGLSHRLRFDRVRCKESRIALVGGTSVRKSDGCRSAL